MPKSHRRISRQRRPKSEEGCVGCVSQEESPWEGLKNDALPWHQRTLPLALGCCS